MLGAIVVIAENGAIGNKGGLLCHLPADLKHFKSVTMGSPIIMGRKTFDSLPKGALPGRLNVVVTRNEDFAAPDVVVCHSIDEALDVTAKAEKRFVLERSYMQPQSTVSMSCISPCSMPHFPKPMPSFLPLIPGSGMRCRGRSTKPMSVISLTTLLSHSGESGNR